MQDGENDNHFAREERLLHLNEAFEVSSPSPSLVQPKIGTLFRALFPQTAENGYRFGASLSCSPATRNR